MKGRSYPALTASFGDDFGQFEGIFLSCQMIWTDLACLLSLLTCFLSIFTHKSIWHLFISLLVSIDIFIIADEISITNYKFDFTEVALKNNYVSLAEGISFVVIAFFIYIVVKTCSLKWMYKTFD